MKNKNIFLVLQKYILIFRLVVVINVVLLILNKHLPVNYNFETYLISQN